MKRDRMGGRLDYCFDFRCPYWRAERFEALAASLMRSFRDIPEVGFLFIDNRSVSITRLHLLDAADRELVARRADGVYRRVMLATS